MSTLTSITRALPINARPRRAHVVWGSLVGAMTLVAGLMMALESRPFAGSSVTLPAAAVLDRSAPAHADYFTTTAPLDDKRWVGIIIHHSGSAMGSADSIARQQQGAGIKSLGYHFVVGNGQGAPDGSVTIGPRWLAQQPGAHAKGPQSEALNRRTIGICLVGDGESRSFTDAQVAALADVVAQLQRRFNIPASQVVLHRDVAATVSPGRLFPEADFRARLAGVAR